MDRSWLLALGLVLVIEGLLPFAAPAAWRQTMARVATLKDGQIRFMGLIALVLGVVLLLW
ncbi:MAG: DUF2065 domain-containing protein [Burkholderiaceae bacterium]